MDTLDKAQLRTALNAIDALMAYDAAISITLEWKEGQPPKLTFVPDQPIKYVDVTVIIADSPKKDFTPEGF